MTKVYKILSSLNQLRWKIALKGILIGFVSGLIVVIYRLGIEQGAKTAINLYAFLKQHPVIIFPWIIFVLMIALFLSWLIKIEPMATGSGIPQVEGILLYGMKIKWYTVLFVRFTAGIIASFFGISLGREGPSIQIGASGSQAIAQKISKNKLEENYLITGGAAAGLSAAFNAPLSGIVFALEEVHRSFSPLILLAATTASLTADVVSKYFFGLKPVFHFITIPQLPEKYYVWLLPIGIISGLIGSLANKALLQFQVLFNKLPTALSPFVALMIALPCGLFIPQILGGGQNLIEIAEKGSTPISIIFTFLVIKLIFTCICFGSGIPGGIFMPILSIGALTGCMLGLIASHAGLSPEYISTFIVCSMAGALSSSVKAPITSILLTAEMTGSLVHLLPVAACSFIALLLSDLLKVTPIYEALLERITHKNKTSLKYKKQGVILEFPVEFGSVICDKKIRDIEWPEHSLVVGIHRGNSDIVPNGATKILSGDYLVILSSEQVLKDINLQMKDLCYSRN
jgi:H+/Cl- antiporter ClcA